LKNVRKKNPLKKLKLKTRKCQNEDAAERPAAAAGHGGGLGNRKVSLGGRFSSWSGICGLVGGPVCLSDGMGIGWTCMMLIASVVVVVGGQIAVHSPRMMAKSPCVASENRIFVLILPIDTLHPKDKAPKTP